MSFHYHVSESSECNERRCLPEVQPYATYSLKDAKAYAQELQDELFEKGYQTFGSVLEGLIEACLATGDSRIIEITECDCWECFIDD